MWKSVGGGRKIRRPSGSPERKGGSLGNFLAKVAEHESELRGVLGWRLRENPTRTF